MLLSTMCSVRHDGCSLEVCSWCVRLWLLWVLCLCVPYLWLPPWHGNVGTRDMCVTWIVIREFAMTRKRRNLRYVCDMDSHPWIRQYSASFTSYSILITDLYITVHDLRIKDRFVIHSSINYEYIFTSLKAKALSTENWPQFQRVFNIPFHFSEGVNTVSLRKSVKCQSSTWLQSAIFRHASFLKKKLAFPLSSKRLCRFLAGQRNPSILVKSRAVWSDIL